MATRLYPIVILIGILCAQLTYLRVQPAHLAAACGALLILLMRAPRGWAGARIVPFAATFVLAWCWAHALIQQRLSDGLAAEHDDKTAMLTVQVKQMAQYGANYVRFQAEVLASKPQDGIPRHLIVNWSVGEQPDIYEAPPKEPLPHVRPGQIWRMYAVLRRPTGLLNPGLLSQEAYYMSKNIRAVAAVKGKPVLLDPSPSSMGWRLHLERLRDNLRERLYDFLDGKRFGGVVMALVLGDQSSIGQDDWQLFNRAGITHLMAISGSHITLVSGLASAVVFIILGTAARPRGVRQADARNTKAVASAAGLFTAAFYSLLAGWGIPAQRTFWMLLCFYLSRLFKLDVSASTVLLWTGAIITLMDPWCVMSASFYLSFGAMLFLIAVGRAMQTVGSMQQRFKAVLKSWLKVQGVLFLGLSPILIVLYHQVSLISPLINAYAIFIIGTIITPASLMLAVLSVSTALDPASKALAELIETLLQHTLALTSYLVNSPLALWDVPSPSVLAAAGTLGALLMWTMPRLNRCHLMWLIPAGAIWFHSGPLPPARGDWRLLAMSVGNAASVLVQTKDHVLLFDTGIRRSYRSDSANMVILPVLRALGIKQIDILVVSHSDIDHVGGFSELVSQIPVQKAFASLRLDHWLSREEAKLQKDYEPLNSTMSAEFCAAGTQFTLDGVDFKFLWPERGEAIPDKAPNSQSCVLQIRGAHHSVLLTGDLESAQEDILLSTGALPQVDVVMVPHHGSTTSSSKAFIEATQPAIAFAQTGQYNRFGHPAAQVAQRWRRAGSTFFHTAADGAVTIRSSHFGLDAFSEYNRRYFYWIRR